MLGILKNKLSAGRHTRRRVEVHRVVRLRACIFDHLPHPVLDRKKKCQGFGAQYQDDLTSLRFDGAYFSMDALEPPPPFDL